MSRPHGTKEFWLSALRSDVAAFRAAAAEAWEADASGIAVPSCPGWSMLGLVHHIGALCQWVEAHAPRGTTDPPEYYVRDITDFPPAEQTLPWFDERAKGLLAMLDALDPALPAWNWAPQAKVGGFWHRRAAHEMSIHRWDAQMALARAEPIEPRLAADGVSEVLGSWMPANRRSGPTDRFGVAHLVAADAEQEWFVRLRGPGFALLDTDTILDTDEPHTRVLAKGHASDLNLALWGRIGFDVLEVEGDEDLLASLRVS